MFRIASMSKSFTASAVLLLRDAGALALDDPAAQYVPELAGWTYGSADAAAGDDQAPADHDGRVPDRRPVG